MTQGSGYQGLQMPALKTISQSHTRWRHERSTPRPPFLSPSLNYRVGSCHLLPSPCVSFKPLICQSRKQQSISNGWNVPGKNVAFIQPVARVGRGTELFPCPWNRSLRVAPFPPPLHTFSFLHLESIVPHGGRQRARSGSFAFL